MPSMPGPMELLVIAALALIVFGPARLPEIARSIGKAVNEFRRQASDLRSEFDLSMDEEPAPGGPGGVRRDRSEQPSSDPRPASGDAVGDAGPRAEDPDPGVRDEGGAARPVQDPDPALGAADVPAGQDPDPTVPAPDEPGLDKS